MDAQEEEVVFSEVIDICEVERTSDVFSNGSFKSLLLAQSTLDNLQKHGFKKPSPVQMKAIPPGIAGLGLLRSFFRSKFHICRYACSSEIGNGEDVGVCYSCRRKCETVVEGRSETCDSSHT